MTNIFVFGSNLAGKHGKGAAKYALDYYGAVRGEGIGRTGNAYAIPTKDKDLVPLELYRIKPHILVLMDYAEANSKLHFLLTRVGSGLAGYSWNTQIRPMFPDKLPDNVELLPPR